MANTQGVGGLQTAHLGDAEDATKGRGLQPERTARESFLLPQRVHR